MAAYAALAFLSFLWGSSFLFIKLAARAFDPVSLALGRAGIAAVALLLTSVLSGRIWPEFRLALWMKLLALALVGQVVPFILLGKAATLTTSADMALMMGAQPIFVFLFGRLLGSRDRWTWLGGLGLLIGFAGVGVTFWSPGGEGGAHSVLGRAFALLAGICYGTGAIISGAATQGDRRRQSGDSLDHDFNARSDADRGAVRESAAACDDLSSFARVHSRDRRARTFQHCARLLRLFPARASGGTDLREPQQLYRAAHRRRRRSGRARRTDRALGLGGPRACAVRRGCDWPVAAAGKGSA